MVVGSWWLDHRMLLRKNAIEIENQRILIRGLQKPVRCFRFNLEENGYVFELSKIEEDLSMKLSIAEDDLMEIVYAVGMWEVSRLENQKYDEVVLFCREWSRDRERNHRSFPTIAVSPQTATSLIRFLRDCRMENKVRCLEQE